MCPDALKTTTTTTTKIQMLNFRPILHKTVRQNRTHTLIAYSIRSLIVNSVNSSYAKINPYLKTNEITIERTVKGSLLE